MIIKPRLYTLKLAHIAKNNQTIQLSATKNFIPRAQFRSTYSKSNSKIFNKQSRLLSFGFATASAVFINHYINTYSLEPQFKESVLETSEPGAALKSKSTLDLLVALLVFKMCSLPYLVDMTPSILSFLDKVYLSAPAYWIIKRTIFKHFCGGEDRNEIRPLMQTLQEAGIGSILDFSIEADLDSSHDYEETRDQINKHADIITGQYCQAVQTAKSVAESFVALKVTGLVSPYLLEKVNNIEHYLRNSFILEDRDCDNVITIDEFKSILEHLPGSNKSCIERVIHEADPKNKGTVDWINYCESLSLLDKNNIALISGCETNESKSNQDNSLYTPFLNSHESQDLERLVQRLSAICQTALEYNVRLMIDAEHSYFQSAIDLVANDLANKYNSLNGKPIVFNTYQLYLKESFSKLRNDLIRAKRRNVPFGAKLVRGAYMNIERQRCQELGLPDIVHDTIEDTHRDYDMAVDLLLNELKNDDETSSYKVNFMIATHNKESMVKACDKINKMAINPSSVMFGQLYGMQDFTTFALAKRGFSAFKYIPYGPVKEVMPYLIRRAQENSTMMGNLKCEEKFILDEIKRRLYGKTQPHIVTVNPSE